eukprot:3316821-Amphidinium_carterae.1
MVLHRMEEERRETNKSSHLFHASQRLRNFHRFRSTSRAKLLQILALSHAGNKNYMLLGRVLPCTV